MPKRFLRKSRSSTVSSENLRAPKNRTLSVSRPRPNFLRSPSTGPPDRGKDKAPSSSALPSPVSFRSQGSSTVGSTVANNDDLPLQPGSATSVSTSTSSLSSPTTTSPTSSSSRSNLSAVSASALSSMKQGLNVLSRKRSPESYPPPLPSPLSQSQSHPSQQPQSQLSPVSVHSSSVNITGSSAASTMQPSTATTATGPTSTTTIRTVPSFEGVTSDSSSDAPSTTTRNSAFSSSVNSTFSMASSQGNNAADDNNKGASASVHVNSNSSLSNSHTNNPKSKLQDLPGAATITNGATTPSTPTIANQFESSATTAFASLSPSSSEFPPQHPTINLSAQIDVTLDLNGQSRLLSPESIDGQYPSIAPPLPSPEQADMAPSANSGAAAAINDPSWDSTIGKAGLGKTGRVINKLVSDNEALKRDIQIERLRAEESKQAAKMLEEKMERLVNDYESRLLEANVTKTLLARKERQVETLTASLEVEKARSREALGREKTWQEKNDKLRQSTQAQVDEANNIAQLMEGRYNAIASHWKDQGEETMKVVGKMRGEISDIVDERRKDDDKINTLRELCDQQHENIKELQKQKEVILKQFENYKREQEEQLRDIKALTMQREKHMESLLSDSKEALDKLRWALNVKKNVKGAQ